MEERRSQAEGLVCRVVGARVTGTAGELEEVEYGSSSECEGEKAFMYECACAPV